ncbi:MAG TPA: cation:proton antiporter, partial [Candidatus Baltobacteraceae bacterium]|nr:cation:proton antiporter [Candidatus Baltobacteraceae bacterium]
MDLHFGVGLITAMLAAALIVGIIAERIHIPYSVALLIAATPIHVNGLEQHFESSLLFVFLPLLIFEAAWNVDTRLLRTNWAPVFLMAVPGVLLTAGLVGFGLSLFNQLPFMPALLLGAILSATDPVALIPILRRLAVPHELAAIVEGESLLNDGVAIVLYTLLVGAVVNGTSLDALAFIGKSLLVSAGGVLIGVVVAVAIAFLLRLTSDTL